MYLVFLQKNKTKTFEVFFYFEFHIKISGKYRSDHISSIAQQAFMKIVYSNYIVLNNSESNSPGITSGSARSDQCFLRYKGKKSFER